MIFRYMYCMKSKQHNFVAPSSANKHNSDYQLDANSSRGDHRRYHRSQKRDADVRRHHAVVVGDNHSELRNQFESRDLEVGAINFRNSSKIGFLFR
ncbi:Uncharacterised protein r2_g3569 [Pycnogonum litorale]